MSDDLLALVSADLHDDVARCAAAAGYRMLVGDAHACRGEWLRARAVTLDAEAVEVLLDSALPRRPGVVLVSDGEPAAPVWRAAMDLGATDAAVLPVDDEHLVRTLSDIRLPRMHPGGVLAVIGAHGGAGASVLASAVALTAIDDGSHVLLLDLDELGAGIDLLFGIESRPGLRWQDLALEGGTVSGAALRNALPRVDDRLSVLTGRRDDVRPIAPDAVLATMDAGRAHGDLVIVDLPRADTPVIRAVAESADLTVVVTTPTVAGCAAARLVVDRVLNSCAAVELAVRGPAPGGLRASQIASAVGVPLLAAYRPDPRLPARLEVGKLNIGSRTPLGRAARAVHRGFTRSRSVAA
ncbi:MULTISPECIES: septum site-determining protein Ssd [unclassified Gordonia (in: high G+C Gram-positive bacteria)]